MPQPIDRSTRPAPQQVTRGAAREPARARGWTSRIRMLLTLFLIPLLAEGLAASEPAEDPAPEEVAYHEYDNSDCLDCHGDEELEADTERGDELDLFVDEEVLLDSIHGEQLCTDCHQGEQDFDDSPHNEGEPLDLSCSGSGCHDDVVEEYQKSIHGMWAAKGDEETAGCPECHGGHDILPASDRKSRTNKFNLHRTCAACHESEAVLEGNLISGNLNIFFQKLMRCLLFNNVKLEANLLNLRYLTLSN